MSKLTFVPIGGLGNRMRAIASAIQFAKDEKCSLRIVWQATNDCNATFEDLFKSVDFEAEGFAGNEATFDKGTFADSPATRNNLWIPKLLRKGRFATQVTDYKPHLDKPLKELLSLGDTYVACCYSVAEYDAKMLQRIFVPTEALARQIEETTSRFTPATIGVHIRRTDNKQSIEESPLASFKEAIEKQFAENKADKIFLCTDDLMVKDYFKENYGDRVLTRDIKYERSVRQAIQDAVVDLWCLGNTSRILGSYYSSFSDTAAELGEIPLEVVRKKG